MPKSTRVLVAFACVYTFWGSTYTAIHIAGEQISAPVVSATRCVISAVLIFAIATARGKRLSVPRGEGWRLAVIGLLFMSGNNMLLTWGEKMMPSGISSLLVSTMPIMIAVMETFLPGGTERLSGRGWAGTLLGTLGIAVLVWPSIHGAAGLPGASRSLLGTLILLGAAFSFAVGSVLSRRFRFKADTFVATGWQLAAAGIFNWVIALGGGGLRHTVWTVRGVEAVVYLAVVGSLFGLVAFTYLLQNVPVTKVATYAFVNPIIAVLLGVWLLGERLGWMEAGGMAIVVCSVALVVLSRVATTGAADATAREMVGRSGEAVE